MNTLEILIENGLNEEKANEIVTEIEKLNLSKAGDSRVWARHGKVRLYFTMKSNKNNGGYVDLLTGKVHASNDKAAEYSFLNELIDGTTFELS